MEKISNNKLGISSENTKRGIAKDHRVKDLWDQF